jgi:hypothetical protein
MPTKRIRILSDEIDRGASKLGGVEPKAYLLQATRAALASPGTVTLSHALLTS